MTEFQVPVVGEVVEKKSYKQDPEGFYRLRITGAERKISKKDNYMIVLKLQRIIDGVESKPTITDYVTLPLANPASEGHTAPNTHNIVYKFFAALDTSFPRKLQWDDADKKYKDADGNVIGDTEARAKNKEILKTAAEDAKALVMDEDQIASLVGQEVLAKLQLEEYEKPDGTKANTFRVASYTLPESEKQITVFDSREDINNA